tara:strand:- start:31 stop:384 length:354 start_codon:yes stop_codon:yes gene_type:complete
MFTAFYDRQNHERNLLVMIPLLFGNAHQTNFGGREAYIAPNKTAAIQYLLFQRYSMHTISQTLSSYSRRSLACNRLADGVRRGTLAVVTFYYSFLQKIKLVGIAGSTSEPIGMPSKL